MKKRFSIVFCDECKFHEIKLVTDDIGILKEICNHAFNIKSKSPSEFNCKSNCEYFEYKDIFVNNLILKPKSVIYDK